MKGGGPSAARGAIVAAGYVSGFASAKLAVGTSGTAVPLPANTHSWEIWTSGLMRVAIGSVPGNTPASYGLVAGTAPRRYAVHPSAPGTIGLQADSGTADLDVYLTFLSSSTPDSSFGG